MDEQRECAILFAATILAARRLHEMGVKPCPARECALQRQSGSANTSLK